MFSFVAVLLSLAILEGASRIFVNCLPNARWQHSQRIYTELGFPAMNALFTADPHLFWKLKSNLHNHVLSGQFANSPPIRFCCSTDARGLRATPPVDSVRSRILFLGDSCTFGLGVDDHQTVPAQVQRRMPRVRCLNGGVPGYTAYQGRVLLDRLELEAPPDVVVISFGTNDQMPWDDLGDAEHARLITAEHARLINRSRLVGLVRSLGPQATVKASARECSERPRLTDEEFIGEITAMVRWCRQRGVEPILMVWPHVRQMFDMGTFPKQAALLRLAQAEQVRSVNLIPVFRAGGGSNLFVDAFHANATGCEVAADTLVKVLQQVPATSAQMASP